MWKWFFGVLILLCGLPPVFVQAQSADDVIAAMEQNFSKYEWINILNIDYAEDMALPVIIMSRNPYERGVGREGVILEAEMVYIKIITHGNRYDLAFDFFDSIRPEKGAQRTMNAKKDIFILLSSIFPDKFRGAAADSTANSE